MPVLVCEMQRANHANYHAQDGQFLLGYISGAAVQDSNPRIRELVTGVLWLVRDNKLYHNVSANREHPQQHFIDEMAPRVAMGTGAKGELMMLEIDGDEPSDQGMSVPQFAAVCQSLGFVQAINVDGTGGVCMCHAAGGGSSTVIWQNEASAYHTDAINRCSDGCDYGYVSDCPWKMTKCQRKYVYYQQ